MSDVAANPAPEWYCPACGLRYFGPGTCANNHPSTVLLHDDGNPEPANPTPVSPEPIPTPIPAPLPTPEVAPDTSQESPTVLSNTSEIPSVPEPAPKTDIKGTILSKLDDLKNLISNL